MRPTQRRKGTEPYNWDKIDVRLTEVFPLLEDWVRDFMVQDSDWEITLSPHRNGERMAIEITLFPKEGSRPETAVPLPHPRILDGDMCLPKESVLNFLRAHPGLTVEFGERFGAWYTVDFSRVVGGKPKCAAGLYMRSSEDRGLVEGIYDELSDADHSRDVLARKIDAIKNSGGKFVTSAEARFVPDDLEERLKRAVWLGASEVSKGLGIDGDVDAWTGDPELVDYLKVLTAQLLTSRISPKVWWERISPDWSGVRDAIDFAGRFGMTPDRYLLMRADIQDIMVPAAERLDLASA